MQTIGYERVGRVSPKQAVSFFQMQRAPFVNYLRLCQTLPSVSQSAFEGDSPVRSEPFDAIELPLGSLWER